jgi:hypothetical protein
MCGGTSENSAFLGYELRSCFCLASYHSNVINASLSLPGEQEATPVAGKKLMKMEARQQKGKGYI